MQCPSKASVGGVRRVRRLFERGWRQQTETAAPNPCDHALRLEGPQNTAGHLAARTDQSRQQGSGEHRRLAEEEVGVISQDAEHATAGLLVDEAIEPLNGFPQNRAIVSITLTARPGSASTSARTCVPLQRATVVGVIATKSWLAARPAIPG